MSDPVCRGSYRLGNACGHCRKCREYVLKILEEMTDVVPCRYDRGNCQVHGLHSRPCPHERAKEVLTISRVNHGFEVRW